MGCKTCKKNQIKEEIFNTTKGYDKGILIFFGIWTLLGFYGLYTLIHNLF
jgi:hypothetical protein